MPSVAVEGTTRFAGVPDTVVTVPLPSVVFRKSSDSALAEIVSALAATVADIGCICFTDTVTAPVAPLTEVTPPLAALLAVAAFPVIEIGQVPLVPVPVFGANIETSILAADAAAAMALLFAVVALLAASPAFVVAIEAYELAEVTAPDNPLALDAAAIALLPAAVALPAALVALF